MSLTCVGPLVDLEVLRPSENLAAARVRAREGLLARVYADVVDQLVLRLERAALPRAALPEAGVRRELGPAHVLDREVRDDVLQVVEHLVAELALAAVHAGLLLDPHAGHLLAWVPAAASAAARAGGRAPGDAAAGAAHVPEEGAVLLAAGVAHRVLLVVRQRQVGRAKVLVVRGRRRCEPAVLVVVARVVAGRGERVLAGMVRELLHAAGGRPVRARVQRREDAEAALGRRRVGRRVERLVLAPHQVVPRGVGAVVTHRRVAHVRRHVRARVVGVVVMRVALGMEVRVVLRRGLAGRRLQGHAARGAGAARALAHGAAGLPAGGQLNPEAGQVVRVR